MLYAEVVVRNCTDYRHGTQDERDFYRDCLNIIQRRKRFWKKQRKLAAGQ